ncbi:OPT superfamily oligopeptide transporter [Aspergillus japonicus CBS 114.51]|uniref:OPT superfamily oligopeptide transporter n=2 Tax=Aspergillus TaxID=5052 RepID=A0A2V5H0R5_ASPV1|nr:OPT superfamily oligopeptide transporter [Aspergillus japonicus CBS 114.51]PYI14313.1 OPT superfamily oligopeptide transporter [Aspergillus violaceofuscus CBS 115571]RAH81314.1 OPT superfamily oligopeptide transporter [Aspergillus japonicus CBS 114.51]
MGLPTIFRRKHDSVGSEDAASGARSTGYSENPTLTPTSETPSITNVPVDNLKRDPERDPKSGEPTVAEAEVEDDPEITALPLEVRQLVSLTDDPTLPTITFRYFVLCIIFVCPGAFLSMMSHFRTREAPYSVFFVQIACHYAGHFLARVLPAWEVRLPFTRWSFNLNPAPWSIKEHVLVTLTAASGATYNLGYTPIAMAELFYGERVNAGVAIFFMFAIVWIGYAFAALVRQVLLYDPMFIWPQALMQTTLFESFRKQDRSSPLARRQMKIFFFSLLGMTLWQFLPEYVFPFTSSLAFLCWVAPRNPVANFIGSGIGGMGFLNLSLDWSNINWNGSSILLTPWWTQVVLFAAFVFNCWVLLPAAKWGNLGSFKYGLMSNSLMMANGTTYPTLKVVTSDYNLNETAYEQYGPMYMGLQNAWATFFDYAKITAAVTWILTFGWTQVYTNVKKFIASRKKVSETPNQGLNWQYHDRLNVLQRAYKEVPLWWYVALFMAGFVALIVILACGYLWIPIWTLFVGLSTAGVLVLPFGFLYAISNYQIAAGSFNELVYGYMVETKAGAGHRHPCGPSVYGSIAGDAWYRAQYMLQDQKIGHYMHIPPKTVFFSQVFGTILGIPINYAVIRWVLDTKGDYLSGEKTDPLGQWSGQSLKSSNTLGVQYAVLGPSRLFKEAEMRPLPWAFLVGAVLPPILYIAHRLLPKSLRIDLWNVSIFFSGMAVFYGNLSTGYTSAFIGGYVVMYWAYRHRFEVWKRYSYMIAAAFDAGFNLNMLLIFLFFGSGKRVSMPNWWGNNADSVERCFALDS